MKLNEYRGGGNRTNGEAFLIAAHLLFGIAILTNAIYSLITRGGLSPYHLLAVIFVVSVGFLLSGRRDLFSRLWKASVVVTAFIMAGAIGLEAWILGIVLGSLLLIALLTFLVFQKSQPF